MAQQPDPTRPTLNYVSPDTDQLTDAQRIRQAMSAGVLVVLFVLGFVFAWILFGISVTLHKPQNDTWFGLLSLAVCGGLLILINAIAYFCYRNRRRRGYALGIWIGLGVAALIEGLCFASLGR